MIALHHSNVCEKNVTMNPFIRFYHFKSRKLKIIRNGNAKKKIVHKFAGRKFDAILTLKLPCCLFGRFLR